MANVQAHTARLIALFIGCILYGILSTTFVFCLRSLLFFSDGKLRLKSRNNIKFPILAATVLMFSVSTFCVVLSLVDVIDAFITYQGPGGALEFYHDFNAGWKHWFLAVEDAIQVILGDALLIYRCYVINDKSWRIIAPPVVMWMGLAAASITCAYRESILPGGKNLNDLSMLPFVSASLFLTFSTSVLTTALIIRRLLTIEYRVTVKMRGSIQPHFFSRLAVIFFETGLIYTLSLIASIGVYLTGSNLEYVAALAMIHIVPITCNLLLIRVESTKYFKFTPEIMFKEADLSPQGEFEV